MHIFDQEEQDRTMEWIVTLSGDNHLLEELSKSFSSADICIQKENGNYVLKSDRFAELSAEQDVRDHAEKLLQLLKGPAKLALGNGPAIKINHILQICEDGTRHCFVHLSECVMLSCSVDVRITNPDGTVEEHHPADATVDWVSLSQKDPAVKMMFDQVSDDFENWHGLYNVFDIIREDVGDIPRKGWCDAGELKRFTQTANSKEAVGVKARHGKWISAPCNPMSLSEAKGLMKKIITEWLQEKAIRYGL